MKALRDNGIEVTALHNHMLDDQPRLFFMHFWANDDAQKLATGLRAALDKVTSRSSCRRWRSLFRHGRSPGGDNEALTMLPACRPAAPEAAGRRTGAPRARGEDPARRRDGPHRPLGVRVERQRLFVAELGNDSVGVVDLRQRKVLRRIAGLSEPQGVAYIRRRQCLRRQCRRRIGAAVPGREFAPLGRIELGDDADNIRVDHAAQQRRRGLRQGRAGSDRSGKPRKDRRYPLKGHPESFQFDETGSRIFVNVPDAPGSPCSMSPRQAGLDVGGGRSELELRDGRRR